jgi:hypothetical protein
MSRILRSCILIFMLAMLAMQQHAQVSIGVNTGITRMKFSGDPPRGVGSFIPKAGFSSNLRFDYRFDNGFALSVQPGYCMLRSKYVVPNDSGTAIIDSTEFRFNSLSMPLHAVVWSENGRFYVLAGFEFTYTLSFKGRVLLTPVPTSNPTYDVSKYNIYAQFGAGFIIPLGKPYLSFEFRYSQGLVDLTGEIIHLSSFLPRTKLTNINLLVGLHIPLGDPGVYRVNRK